MCFVYVLLVLRDRSVSFFFFFILQQKPCMYCTCINKFFLLHSFLSVYLSLFLLLSQQFHRHQQIFVCKFINHLIYAFGFRFRLLFDVFFSLVGFTKLNKNFVCHIICMVWMCVCVRCWKERKWIERGKHIEMIWPIKWNILCYSSAIFVFSILFLFFLATFWKVFTKLKVNQR